MIAFKKKTNILGDFKGFTIANDAFVDTETGEEIDVAKIIGETLGDAVFDLKVSLKSEEDI